MDSLHIKTEVVNPENREITVNAIVESFDHSIADTLSMYDDGNHNDGEADDGIYGSFWNGTSDENFYNIHIETISVESGNSDINEDANYFTTVGPVKYNNSVIAQKRGNTHRMRLYLKNEGLVASAPNVNVEMSIADSSIIIGDNYRYFGNIDPGQTAQSNSFYSIEAENPPNSVVAQMQIFSNDKLFWTDTFNLVFNDTEISNPEHSGPKEFALKQNFPNPFNPTTTFEYEIPTESNVIITIYDLNGRIIDTLVNRRHEPGYYSMQWNADGVGSGIYLYKMEANNFVEMKKLSVIK